MLRSLVLFSNDAPLSDRNNIFFSAFSAYACFIKFNIVVVRNGRIIARNFNAGSISAFRRPICNRHI